MTSSVKAVAREPSEGKRGLRSLFKRSYLAIPYGLFLAMFVVFPLFLIVYYAFTDKSGGFTFANFIEFFTTTSYISNVLISIGIACVTTAVCLLIAYPVAYILSRFKSARSYILVLLFVMPMWINFVLRALSLRELLDLLGLLGKTNFLNTVIGMVYDFLPFMILPLYTTLIKMDRSLEEASADLGANGVVIAEPVAGLLSPALSAEFSGPYVKQIVDAVQDDSFLVIYHNCGNSTIQMIDSILETGSAAYHFGNAIDMAEMMTHIPAGTVAMGNVDPAGEFRNGTPESIRAATLGRMLQVSQLCDLLRLRYPAALPLGKHRRVFRRRG